MLSPKLFGGLAVLAVAIGVAAAAPGLTPKVEVGFNRALKSDRLDSRTARPDTVCRQDKWPYGCEWQAPSTVRPEQAFASERPRSRPTPRPKVTLSAWKRYIESGKRVN
jgi:hypothetical protein